MSLSNPPPNHPPLSDIRSVVFYKCDQFTTDLICCDIEAGGQVWTSHEEAEGWDALLHHLEQLPGFRADWRLSVVQPPFALNGTVAFRR